jgi:hypothetical protein
MNELLHLASKIANRAQKQAAMQQFLMRARTLALFLAIYSEQSSENVAQQEQVERVHYD